MKCRHCGNNILGDVKFCTLCGNPVDGENVLNTNNTVGSSSKRKLYYDNNSPKVHGNIGNVGTSFGNGNKGCIGCFVVFFIMIFIMVMGILGFVMTSFNSFKDKEFIEFGADTMPTLFELFGVSEICSVSSEMGIEENEIVLEYCNKEDNNYGDLFKKYVDHLIDNENFEMIQDGTITILKKESEDEGLDLIIEVDYSNNSISYNKEYSDEYE